MFYSTRNSPSRTSPRVPSVSSLVSTLEEGVLAEEDEAAGLEEDTDSSFTAALESDVWDELLEAGVLLELVEEEPSAAGLLLELDELLEDELELELLEEAAVSLDGSSFSEEELEELEELLGDELELDELLELTPLSKETWSVLLVTSLSL